MLVKICEKEGYLFNLIILSLILGLTDTRNSTHGSDSDETAEAEIKFFFPEFKYEQFFSCGQDEQFLKSQNNQSLRLDRTLFQHFI